MKDQFSISLFMVNLQLRGREEKNFLFRVEMKRYVLDTWTNSESQGCLAKLMVAINKQRQPDFKAKV